MSSPMLEFPDDAMRIRVAAEKAGRSPRTLRDWAANGWIRRWRTGRETWVSKREVIACAKEQNWKRIGQKPGWGRGHKRDVDD